MQNPLRPTTTKTRVAVFGGPGGGAVVAQSIRDIEAVDGTLELAGFLNDVFPVGHMVSGAPVLGKFSAWQDLPQDTQLTAPLHKVKEMQQRAQRIRALGVPQSRWISIIDPNASVASDVSLAYGAVISAQATVMPAVQIGAHVVVRHGAVIAHNTVLRDYVYVGSNAVLCGYVQADEGAHIAPGALIREHVRIGRFSVVGLGSVVLHDVPDFAMVAGNPAEVIGDVAPA